MDAEPAVDVEVAAAVEVVEDVADVEEEASLLVLTAPTKIKVFTVRLQKFNVK